MNQRLNALLVNIPILFPESKYKKISSSYAVGNCKRIYFAHIRKTGGTSLINMFLSLDEGNCESLYAELVSRVDHRIINDGKIFVGWNKRLIERGNYFYAFSHIPLHKLKLPTDTFIISCFRDPIRRVMSYYDMLVDMRKKNDKHPCMKTEGKYIGETFDDFLERVPQEHLANQLYMFSQKYDVCEALDRANKLSYYFFTDDFDNGISELNMLTSLRLKPLHMRKKSSESTDIQKISEKSMRTLKSRLAKEYEFMDTLKNKRVQ